MRLYFNVALSIALLLIALSCEWTPPHDNILDPDNIGYRPLGSLKVTVLTLELIGDPVAEAFVQLPELGRVGTTDNSGVIIFNELPEGEWQVIAQRDNGSEPVYAPDTSTFVITQAHQTQISFHLDALPIFSEVKVISISQYVGGVPGWEALARLTARVSDPDERDFNRVEWKLIDSDGSLLKHDTLEFYNQDSAYFWEEIPSEDFPRGTITSALGASFDFIAFDNSGNTSEATALLGDVIYGLPPYPSTVNSYPPKPRLTWGYAWAFVFTRQDEYYFQVRIYDANQSDKLVYDKRVNPTGSYDNEHTVEISLMIGGSYRWDVWVLDMFGDQARSERQRFIVETQ